ncbi:UDP-N-acetylglucosamine 2-epimerase (non-hydrolyzing) [Candidatus Woesearchaeota archaeon]|nr:UDP-N-acetylglucosamine 2-epimerase (non-hydrolyzing) [Candidatus Woesearchaeota archaeon]
MKILSVVGARPQFIKLAVLSHEIRKHFDEVVVHTGQHYDYEMSKIFFKNMRIPEPDYNLGVGSAERSKQIKKMIDGLCRIILKEKPSLVIVFGDTNSTLAGAMAASKSGIKIAHIESGMRSFNKSMPEEINRVETDRVSDILFCPTWTAVQNLKKERITKNVFKVGDVMIDSIKRNIGIAEKNSRILGKLKLNKKSYLLATVHRAGNTDIKENLSNIMGALLSIGEKIVFPVHPRTAKCLKLYNLDKKLKNSNIIVTKPLSYADTLILEKNAKKIITDSGGMQKEAYFFKVPCITLRDSTEWTETVNDGWNILAGANKAKIRYAVRNFNPKGKQSENYGNGNASRNIVNILKKFSL